MLRGVEGAICFVNNQSAREKRASPLVRSTPLFFLKRGSFSHPLPPPLIHSLTHHHDTM